MPERLKPRHSRSPDNAHAVEGGIEHILTKHVRIERGFVSLAENEILWLVMVGALLMLQKRPCQTESEWNGSDAPGCLRSDELPLP